MLNYFNKIVVPDVPHVDLYQDDENPAKFWMVPQLPRAATGVDGKPDVALFAYARDLSLMAGVTDPLPPGETEGGLLNMTVECTVSQADQDKIRNYLRGSGLTGHAMPMMHSDGIIRLAWRQPLAAEPVLAYPTWVDGSVQFCLPSALGPTFIKPGDSETHPSLTASNVASFTIGLGEEGVRLFRGAMDSGKLPAHVAYTLQFAARLPALSIHIHGHTDDVYQELKDHSTIVESSGGVPVRTYPQVSSLQQLRTMCGSLAVEFDENQIATANDPALTKKLEDLALDVAQSYLKNMFAQPVVNGQLDPAKLGTDPLQNFKDPNLPVAGGNQLWLKNFTQHATADLDMTFTGNITRAFAAYPNSALLGIVSVEELKQAFYEVDLNTPIFSILQVPVRVTADFEHDPVADVQVTLDYHETDDRTGKVVTQTMTGDFVKGDEVYYFRTPMAKNADGSPKNNYTYSSKVNYKAAAKPSEIGPVRTTERSLIIGYDRLDCVAVNVMAGAVPWNAVDSVEISLSLPGVSLPTASTRVVLTQAAASQSWFTYTGGADVKEYQYSSVFWMHSGQSITVADQHSSAATLLVDAPFNDRMDVVFVPQGAFPPVARIVLSAKYADTATGYHMEGTHVFTSPSDTWTWSVNLRDATKRTFSYRADVTYADGSTSTGDWRDGAEGTVLVGDVKSSLLPIEVSPAVLDLSKYKLVAVRLDYTDPSSAETQTHTMQFSAAKSDNQTWTVSLHDPHATGYVYTMTLYGTDGSKKIVGPTNSQDALLVLEAGD
jgi:hypothetical protein